MEPVKGSVNVANGENSTEDVALGSKRMQRDCRQESAAVRRSLMILMMDRVGSRNQPRKVHKGDCR